MAPSVHPLAWRIAISAIFIASAVRSFATPGGFEASGKFAVVEPLTRMGLEPVPDWLVALAPTLTMAMATLAFLGGTAILFGGAQCGAVMCMLFLGLVTPIAHWPLRKDGSVDDMHMVHVMKNLAIFGGLLLVFARDSKSAGSAAAVAAGKKAQ